MPAITSPPSLRSLFAVRIERRHFFRGVLVALASASTIALLKPRLARAAEWPKDAFSAKTVDEALRHLYGSAVPASSPKLKLQAPYQASDGARITLSISTTLPNVQSISILVDKNPRPLAAHITPRGALGYFSTNIKMASTSEVRCVVKAGNKLYSVKQTIKVTAGGCD